MFSARKSSDFLTDEEELALFTSRKRSFVGALIHRIGGSKETVIVEVYSCEKVGNKTIRNEVLQRSAGTSAWSSISFRAARADMRHIALRKLTELGINVVDDTLKVKCGRGGDYLTYTYQLRPDELSALKKRKTLHVGFARSHEPALATA